jgi:hypothetical protein
MDGFPNFPQSPAEVLAIIEKAERSRKFVWTAGRVLKEGAFVTHWAELRSDHRKLVLQKTTGFLEVLADQHKLERREISQSIGFGNEIGFDCVHHAGNQT